MSVWVAAVIALYGCGGGGGSQSSVLAIRPPVPSPTGSTAALGPYHIETAAYDDTNGEGQDASPAQVNQLVSFALNEGSGKPVVDCHTGAQACQAVYYMRPYWIRNATPTLCFTHPDSDVMAAATESWFLHLSGYSDSAHRVWGIAPTGCTFWAMNPNSAAVQAWWQSWLISKAGSFDLFFIDMSPMNLATATWFSGGGGCAPHPTICTSTQELPNDAAVVSSHVNFVSALRYANGNPMHFIYQQAYANQTEAGDLNALSSTSRFVAVTCEGCISNVANAVEPGNYKPYLDEMAAVNNTSAAFYIISDGNAPSGSATQMLQRLVTTGVAWLAYREGHVIVQPNLEDTTSNLAVWPEDLIYPSQPFQTMSTGASDLQVASGVWRREFGVCYQKGVPFGRCAAVVNSTANTVTVQASWLTKTYGHVISLSGGDELSGGAASVASVTFTAGITTIGPGGALLLAQ